MRKTVLRSVLFLAILFVASFTSMMLQAPKVEGQTVDWNHVAQVAWRYYQPGVGVDATTGLSYGTLDWHYITDWDTGNYLIAILDARALSLIQDTGEWGTDYRLGKVLHYLETRQLRDGNTCSSSGVDQKDGLPYAAYVSTSTTGAPACDMGLSKGLKTDYADTGRLLVALYVLETRRPDLATQVTAILQRVTPTGTTLWNVYNTAFIQGKTHGGLYEYYATLGFKQFGFDVSSSLTSWNNLKAGPQVNVYGQPLPRADVTTEPFLNGILEIPNLIDDGFKGYAARVLEAQEGRWQATGYLTGWSEGASDVSTFYLYEWIVDTNHETTSPVPWKLDDTAGGPPQSDKVPILYTKVAIGLHAIFGTDYTQRLVNAVLGKVETQYGFREGITEKTGEVIGTPTWPIQDKENSLILSAAWYALNEPVMRVLLVATIPSIAVPMTWDSGSSGTAAFDIVSDAPFTVVGLTTPLQVSISGVTYYFKYWELDGTAQPPNNNVVASVSVGGDQPNVRTAAAYYLPSLWDAFFNAPKNTVYFIGNTNPYDNQAMLGAWAKTTNQQQIGLWTTPGWVDQATGRPLVSVNNNLVLVAGPLANKIVGYYESQGLTVSFRWGNVNGVSYAQIVYRGQVLAQMPESDIGSGKDIFVFQIIRDNDGRLVLSLWGIGAQGTLASGVWLADVGNYPSWQSRLSSMSDILYVCQWADANGDKFPQPGEITVLYQGN